MKSLVAIVVLINCLAFFMLGHLQKQSAMRADLLQKQIPLPLNSPAPLTLLSELRKPQLQTLDATLEVSPKPAEIESDNAAAPVEVKSQ